MRARTRGLTLIEIVIAFSLFVLTSARASSAATGCGWPSETGST